MNGEPLDVSRSPYAAFVGLARQTVTLTVSEKPTKAGDAREVVVEPLSWETPLWTSRPDHRCVFVSSIQPTQPLPVFRSAGIVTQGRS